MTIYAAIALVGDKATGAFSVAKSPDDAAARLADRLPDGAKIVFLRPIMTATLSAFERGKLYTLLSREESLEFIGDSVVHLAKIQQIIIERQCENIRILTEALQNKIRQIREFEK